MTITLPVGHQWEEIVSGASHVFAWKCRTCTAIFQSEQEQDGTVTTLYDPPDENECSERKESQP